MKKHHGICCAALLLEECSLHGDHGNHLPRTEMEAVAAARAEIKKQKYPEYEHFATLPDQEFWLIEFSRDMATHYFVRINKKNGEIKILNGE